MTCEGLHGLLSLVSIVVRKVEDSVAVVFVDNLLQCAALPDFLDGVWLVDVADNTLV
jgi:hypothetical protein